MSEVRGNMSRRRDLTGNVQLVGNMVNEVSESSTDSQYPSAKAVENRISSHAGKKVDKESGKGLSTNDFTTEHKEKLENIKPADWSQNDETQPDFVKNRTHYSASKSVVREIVTESDGIVVIHLTNDFKLNEKYKFILKNQVCEIMFAEDGEPVDVLGDVFTLYGSTDEFYIVTPFGRGYEHFIGDIYEEIVVPLPEKYIPDSVARTAEIGDINAALEEIIELQEELMTPDGDEVSY